MPLSLPWQVVLPVKRARHAKTRLTPPAGTDRAELARAMTQDTLVVLSRVVGAGHVVVVTSDEVITAMAETLGALVVPDPGSGLDDAVRAGLRVCRRGAPVAVLLGDLPALRPADLEAALTASARHTRSVVPDQDGTGTVLLTSTGAVLEPAFGQGSADRHARTAARLELDLPRLRQDVDDADDLAAALVLGVGPATAAVLRLQPRIGVVTDSGSAAP